jgi:hypothetical protein
MRRRRGRLVHVAVATLLVGVVLFTGTAPAPRLTGIGDARASDLEPDSELTAPEFWYLEGRGWIRSVREEADGLRVLVWTGDHDVSVRVPPAAVTDETARLEGYRRAVRDRIVWMSCLDPRDPGGGDEAAQIRHLQAMTGQSLATQKEWHAWWHGHGDRLTLAWDGQRLVMRAPGAPEAVSAPADSRGEDSTTRIVAITVTRESADSIVLGVEYVYGGEHGSDASIGVISLLDGESLGHWAYRPAPVFKGHHVAHVMLSLNESAPPRHFTNQVEATIYVGRKGTLARSVHPLDKEWLRLTP